jgi:hypothetical protein
MVSFFLGVLGGIVSWFATTAVGQPILTFMSLHSRATKLLVLYEHGEGQPQLHSWLVEREKFLRDCGADLFSFGMAFESISRQLERFGYSPITAGMAMMELALKSPSRELRLPPYSRAIDALKLTSVLM